MFDENIVAWKYGPVVESVFHEFKGYGADAIYPDEDFDSSIFKPEEIDLIKEVYEVYGQFSALKLMNMTHEESPWQDTKINGVITHQKLRNYFSKLVEE
jgi:uncharacterized phage-associated protein